MKIPKEEQEKIYSKFRELLFHGNNMDTICQLLKIQRSTYFKYKKKLIKEVIREYKPNPQEVEYQRSETLRSLLECKNVNIGIMLDPKASSHERSEASIIQATAQAQIQKLTEEGYIKPQLPRIVSLQEDSVKWVERAETNTR